MKLTNRTPLKAFAFRQFDTEGGLDCVVAVRGTFVHAQDAAMGLGRPQEPFQWEDLYEGDPHTTPLLRQGDLVPGKPGTDVTFLGSSHAPQGRAAGTWTCGLRLGPVHKTIRVFGPRAWTPQVRQRWAGWHANAPREEIAGWELSEPEPVRAVAVD